MKTVHRQEEEQFALLFQQEAITRIPDRMSILRVFLATEKHLTSGELIEVLRREGLDYDPEFVRETLRLMSRYGFAQRCLFSGHKVVYEHRHLGTHHDHMICIKCGDIAEFKDEYLERIQAQVVAKHGFHMLQHKMEIYGICARCMKQRVDLMPLMAAKPGENVIVKDFIGGARAKFRLLSMGLRVGDALEVITNNGVGQVVVAADLKRFALGRGLAQKILVEPNGTRKDKASQ